MYLCMHAARHICDVDERREPTARGAGPARTPGRVNTQLPLCGKLCGAAALQLPPCKNCGRDARSAPQGIAELTCSQGDALSAAARRSSEGTMMWLTCLECWVGGTVRQVGRTQRWRMGWETAAVETSSLLTPDMPLSAAYHPVQTLVRLISDPVLEYFSTFSACAQTEYGQMRGFAPGKRMRRCSALAV